MVLITLSAVNAVSAADSSVIYVNNSGGNDIWDGQYAEWIVDTLSGPKKSIKNATGTVSEGGTVQISNGVYTGTGNTNITISRNMTITGQNKDKTIISGNDTNWIFKVVSNVSVTIQNLTMTNGNATYGGAIYNNGTLTVFDSIFPNNKATALGGAIYNYNGTISSLKGCTFTNNSAGFGGAIDNNYCTIGTVIDCNFTGNNAIYGGAISNWEGNITTLSGSTFSNNAASKSGGAVSNYKGIITNWSNCNLTNNTAADEDYGGGAVFNYGTIANLSGCNFIGNNATDSGGAIYNNGTINVHFNIFLNNSATKGSAIYCSDGTVDAEYNWWGSNDNPSGKISGFAVSKWIVLTVNVSSTSISRGKTSTITADLLHDSDGVYHDPADGHVPDGVNVSFKSDSLGHVNSESVSTSNGIATTTFISENLGLATVSAAADSQTMNTQISAGRNDVYVSNTGSDTDGDGSQSNPFKTIKTGILNVFPGGRLHIADGTYTGENNTNVAISSDMTITGQIRDSTIINGTNSAQIFQIQNGVNVKIVNLTLTNGNSANGGAICNYGNLTVANCTFTGNTANSGGAIFNYGVLTIENNTFTNNTATETDFDNGGGAIFNEATVTVNGSDFTGNKANNGGAIYNKYTCIVKDSSFVNNTAVTYAGAIYNYFSTLNVTNTIFSDNNASSGGAVFNDGGYSTIKDCTFNSNVALNEGGAIDNFKDVMTDYQYLTLIDTTFTGNRADSGGAIVNSGYLNITNGTFKNNTVEFGGAIFNYASLNVVKSTFISNAANGYGGAVYNHGNLTVNGSMFMDNTAIYNGGAIYNSYGNLTVHFSKILGNAPNDIYRESGLADVEYNWWGLNDGPSTGRVVGKVVSKWLVLTVTANPTIINNGRTSTITADLLHDNGILSDPTHPQLYYHDPTDGHVTDGISIIFTTDLGNVGSKSVTKYTLDGIAAVILNANEGTGTATVTVTLDNQLPLSTTVNIILDEIAPTVSTIDPAKNAKINATNKEIKIVFSENIKAGDDYNSITVTGPSGPVSITKNINGNVLTLTSDVNFTNGVYSVNLPINAVTDIVGNGLVAVFTSSFTVDMVPPVVTANPASKLSNNSIGVNLLSESDAKIYYRLNNGSWNTFTGRGTVYIINVGTNKLEFYAVDLAGNPSAHTTYTYTIDKKAPVVTATPTSGLSKSISVTLSSESNAKIYYRLNGGSWHNFTGTGKLSITSSGTNKLEFYAVDAAGNPSVHKIYTYTIDKTAPKVISTYPKRYAAGVSRTARIYLKFSEKIKTSINWSKIVVKDKYGHTVKISKSISGNILYIKTGKRSSYSYYTVYIPKSAVKDYAGNNLAAGYIFKFKTGRY